MGIVDVVGPGGLAVVVAAGAREVGAGMAAAVGGGEVRLSKGCVLTDGRRGRE
jgi:hypothetical protein